MARLDQMIKKKDSDVELGSDVLRRTLDNAVLTNVRQTNKRIGLASLDSLRSTRFARIRPYAKLQTTVYRLKFARHALKLHQNPFQATPIISFFDCQLFFPDLFSAGFLAEKKIGCIYCQDLEEMTIFGRLQQIAEGFLLRIHSLSGLHDSLRHK